MRRFFAILLIVIISISIAGCSNPKEDIYNKAVKAFMDSDYTTAKALFEQNIDYKDSKSYIISTDFEVANKAAEAKKAEKIRLTEEAKNKSATVQTITPPTPTPIPSNQDSMANKEIVERVTLKDYKPTNSNDCSQGEVIVINKLQEIIKEKPNVSKIVIEYGLLWSVKDNIKIIYYRNEKVLKRYAKSENDKVWALEEYNNVSDEKIFNATIIAGGDLGESLFSQVNKPED